MRIVWSFSLLLVAIYKIVIPFFFFLLTITTAPEDTAELLREGKDMMETLNQYPAVDILLIVLVLIGLFVQFGGDNWRHVFHRIASKPRLKRLSEDAKRVAEDIARTMAEHRAREDEEITRDRNDRVQGINNGPMWHGFRQDQRYLAKHMMESHSVIERLKKVKYWNPSEHFHEIGVAGATTFAAESTCKSLYAASEQIRCDVEDGFWPIITKPNTKKVKNEDTNQP